MLSLQVYFTFTGHSAGAHNDKQTHDTSLPASDLSTLQMLVTAPRFSFSNVFIKKIMSERVNTGHDVVGVAGSDITPLTLLCDFKEGIM